MEDAKIRMICTDKFSAGPIVVKLKGKPSQRKSTNTFAHSTGRSTTKAVSHQILRHLIINRSSTHGYHAGDAEF